MTVMGHTRHYLKQFQREEETNGSIRSPSVALLCAGVLGRGIVCVLERVIR